MRDPPLLEYLYMNARHTLFVSDHIGIGFTFRGQVARNTAMVQ